LSDKQQAETTKINCKFVSLAISLNLHA